MEFTKEPADAMAWPSLAAAARDVEKLWEFGARHVLSFRKQGPRSSKWVCHVAAHPEGALGYIAPFMIRAGEPRFL